MTDLKTFRSEEFGTVRTLNIDNDSWFVAKDIALILGYANASKAIADHVDDEDKLNNESLSSLGQRGGWLVNESGLYSLILSSKLPNAKKFKRWVTSEVLPSIRTNGGYIAGQETMSDDELFAKALLVAQNKIAQRDAIISKQNEILEEQKPKVLFASAVETSKSSILVGELAKIICQNGYAIGQKRLFDYLRENGFLIKSGSSKNMPTQKSMDLGLFEIKESTIQNADGSVRVTKTPKVTGKGQIYFVERFLRK